MLTDSQKEKNNDADQDEASIGGDSQVSTPVSPPSAPSISPPPSPDESVEAGVRVSPPRLQPSTTWYGMHCVVPIDSDDLFDLDAASNVLGEILELLDKLYKKVVTLMNSG